MILVIIKDFNYLTNMNKENEKFKEEYKALNNKKDGIS